MWCSTDLFTDSLNWFDFRKICSLLFWNVIHNLQHYSSYTYNCIISTNLYLILSLSLVRTLEGSNSKD